MRKKVTFKPQYPYADELYQPAVQPALKLVPQWFKDISPEINAKDMHPRLRGTVKKCVPFLDALTTGYSVCLPYDITIEKDTEGNHKTYWNFADHLHSVAMPDAPYRYEGMPVPKGYCQYIWRFEIPFLTSTPKDYSILVTHPFNRYDLPFLTLSGVIDSDNFSHNIVANAYIRDDFEGVLEKGTPILQIFPFKRTDWEHEFSDYDSKIQRYNFKMLSVMTRSYLKQFWQRKSYQ